MRHGSSCGLNRRGRRLAARVIAVFAAGAAASARGGRIVDIEGVVVQRLHEAVDRSKTERAEIDPLTHSTHIVGTCVRSRPSLLEAQWQQAQRQRVRAARTMAEGC